MQQTGAGGGAAGGGSQYGMTPEMTAFTTASTTASSTTLSQQQQQILQQQQQHKQVLDSISMLAEAASPISSRPPARPSGNFEELAASGGFPDDEGFGGEEAERGGGGGNRWPRQETIALLKIRSEMDAAFRDATLKGPLWEDVSRKLAQQGYTRSAKKCKEKFENVHKYYKRTKEGRAGRQDGKSYRFFSQLEALHTPTTATASTPVVAAAPTPVSVGIGMVGSSSGRTQVPTSDPATTAAAATTTQIGVSTRISPSDLPIGMPAAGISFSSNTSDSDSDGSEDDLLEEGPSNTAGGRKRKRGSSGGGGGGSSTSRRMMEFFEGLMKQVMDKQEVMQQRFLETIEKREQDRMIREEAWKRQEMARLTREHEIMAQERAISASRDAAIIAFLQKITGQTIQFPPTVVIPAAPPPPPPQAQSTTPPPAAQQQQQQHHQPKPQLQQPQPQTPQPQHHHHHTPQQQKHHHPHHATQAQAQATEITRHQPASSEIVLAAVPEQQHPPQEMVGGSGTSFDSASSRWPKQEVIALINLRSGLESKYQEAGPKGPLWEEISSGMRQMGYNRSSKRCKEKWENINKYFKKVKESNKKRPEDAKTCPYFHQLDALYRKKTLGGSGSSSAGFGNQNKQEDSMAIDPSLAPSNLQAIMAPPSTQPLPHTTEAESKNNNVKNGGNMEEQQTSKEGFFDEGSGGGASSAALKKPEDIMKELIKQHQQQQQPAMGDYDKMEELDSDNLDQDEDDEDDDEEDEEAEEESKMAYKIQFQRQNVTAGSSSNGGGNAASSFLAMVQ